MTLNEIKTLIVDVWKYAITQLQKRLDAAEIKHEEDTEAIEAEIDTLTTAVEENEEEITITKLEAEDYIVELCLLLIDEGFTIESEILLKLLEDKKYESSGQSR